MLLLKANCILDSSYSLETAEKKFISGGGQEEINK
jgi:hypothetical protein